MSQVVTELLIVSVLAMMTLEVRVPLIRCCVPVAITLPRAN